MNSRRPLPLWLPAGRDVKFMQFCSRENFNKKFREISMKFLKLSNTKFSTDLYPQAISVCTCSAVPAGENADLGHTATGQSHACKIDPQIRPALHILPTHGFL